MRDIGRDLDYKRFRVYLKDKFKVQQAYLFIGYRNGNQHRYTQLQKDGYIIIFKPTLETKNGVIKGNCDAELVLHTMIEYSNFEKAVIVTGDGDFHCLVEHLLEKEKLLKLMIPRKDKYSALLRKFRQNIFFINDPYLKHKIIRQKQK